VQSRHPARLSKAWRVEWLVLFRRQSVPARFAAFLRDRRGSVSIEYGLIAVAISISIVGVLQLIATDLSTIFAEIENGFVNR
jgi:Flp pilus assembly pilin Flp